MTGGGPEITSNAAQSDVTADSHGGADAHGADTPLLSIQALDAVYAGEAGIVKAVDGVSIAVARGEFFTLLGPSGCGKTTTLRCVAGFERPTAGSIRIDGVTVSCIRDNVFVPVHQRDIAMVFQSYAIWPHMTVAQNVAFPLETAHVPRREVRNRVMRALEMIGLADLHDRPATHLSGGQQQRVALARAVVKDARLLLLDEPLSNLDARLRVQMRRELGQLQSRLGTTTIYVTHDQDEALSLSDRIAVMRDGKVVEIGTPRALYLAPRHLFTAEFLGQTELLPARSVTRDGDTLLVETPIGTLRVANGVDEPSGRTVMIRPEHIEFATPGDTGPNLVDGRVAQVAFTGRVVEYAVATGSTTLSIHALSGSMFDQGEAVRLRLPPERCVLVGDADDNHQDETEPGHHPA